MQLPAISGAALHVNASQYSLGTKLKGVQGQTTILTKDKVIYSITSLPYLHQVNKHMHYLLVLQQYHRCGVCSADASLCSNVSLAYFMQHELHTAQRCIVFLHCIKMCCKPLKIPQSYLIQKWKVASVMKPQNPVEVLM